MHRHQNSSLFHFTRTADALCAILDEGFWPKYCVEDIRWQDFEEGYHFVAFPITSFCDIPLLRISDHAEFYGKYGIGLSKDWATRKGLNPVLYVQSESAVKESFLQIFEFMHRHASSNEKEQGHVDWTRHLLSFVKPLKGQMHVEGKLLNKDFYNESEWRYVPKSDQFPSHMLKTEFDNQEQRDHCERLTKKHASLNFVPNDIRHVFVPTDADIPRVLDFILKGLERYSMAELKILMSRVTSLETVTRDI